MRISIPIALTTCMFSIGLVNGSPKTAPTTLRYQFKTPPTSAKYHVTAPSVDVSATVANHLHFHTPLIDRVQWLSDGAAVSGSHGESSTPSSQVHLLSGVHDALHGPFPVKAIGKFHWNQPDDGIIHINGDWRSPYCPGGKILQSNAAWINSGTVLRLSVPGGTCNAGEWETDAGMSPDGGKTYPYGAQGYGYGYYQITMKTGYGPADGIAGSSAGGTGTVESFFLKGLSAGNLANLEVDIEFLTNGRWDTPRSRRGEVWFTLDGASGDNNGSKRYVLPFNPSAKFHTYGIDYEPGTATWYVDGKVVQTQKVADALLAPNGIVIMANDWTGNSNWGGTKPAKTVSAEYKDLEYLRSPKNQGTR